MSVLFSDIVRRGRERAGLSQARVAQLIGKSASTVRAWEQGRTKPGEAQSVSALAAVLGLDETELLDQAGFEAAPGTAPKSAREELSSLAAERSEIRPPQPAPSLPLVSAGTPAVDAPPEFGPRHLHDGASSTIEHGKPRRQKVLPDTASATTDQTRPQPSTSKTPKVTTVTTRPVASPGQAPVSYLEEAEERDFYRRRAVATAIILVILLIILWWSIGRTGNAFSDFIESFVDELNL